MILAVVGLTFREALRRKLIAAYAAISAFLVALSAWGFDRLSHTHTLTSGEVDASLPQALILFMFMFSFVVALSASTMSSPAIAAEIESGVLQAVATRPIRRSEILIGKWVGLSSVLALYATAVCALEFAVVDAVSGFAPPDPAAVWAYLLAEGIVLLSVALLFSTRFSTLATGVVAVAVFGAAWLAGVVGSLGTSFHIGALRQIGQVARYLVPTDGLWHGAIYYLEPHDFVTQQLGQDIGNHANPFFASAPPSWAYLVWVAGWLALVLAASLVVFDRRSSDAPVERPDITPRSSAGPSPHPAADMSHEHPSGTVAPVVEPPAPRALGRSLVVRPGGAALPPWEDADRLVVDDGALACPAPAVDALHSAWVSRRPVVVELACDPTSLRAAERYEGPVHELPPDFEFSRERLHFLVWANAYDARSGGAIWWHGRRAARRLTAVEEGGPADLRLADGTALYVDGGPPDPPDLPTGTPVVHRWSAEAGSLVAAAHAPPVAALAPDQLAAVAHRGAGARVVAPAGSGKTRVLTERLRHLVVGRRVHPASITAVAFNRQAAAEMAGRCRDVASPAGPAIRTLNSLAYWICNDLGGQGRLAVLEEREARALVEAVFPVPRQANADTVAPYLDALGAVRLGLRHPEEVAAEIGDVPGLAERFEDYRSELAARRALDFDEQIYRAVELLVREPEARRRAQERCRRLLVDEFQDLNPAHLLLVRLLAAPAYDCFGVGDDDQVIYGYSGATPEFLIRFPTYFPGATSHALEVNYRCPPAIVGAVRNLLSHNRDRIAKTIVAAAGRTDPTPTAGGPLAGAGPVAVVRAPGEELAHRCTEVLTAWRDAGVSVSDMAVLARVNAALLPVQVACAEAGIPATPVLTGAVLRRTGIRTALAYLRMGCAPDDLDAGDVRETLHRPSRRIARNVAEMLTRRPRTSVRDIRRLAASLTGGDGPKLLAFARDVETVAAACRTSAAAALRSIRVSVGLGEAMDVLDGSRREADRSTHTDDLLALESVAALHAEAVTFEGWLREVLARRGPTGAAVQLSSVHKIKGREWPRVVVFGATRWLFPHRLSEDVEGDRRVFHVALTRATTQVAVLADEAAPSRFVAELERTAPRAPVDGPPDQETNGDRTGGTRRRADRHQRGTVRPARREDAAVAAAVGIELEHGGHPATVVETRATGAVVKVGGVRIEIPYGAQVRVAGRMTTLSAPSTGDGGPVETALRAWRSATAKAERVPAYVVLNDKDLVAVAVRQPGSLAELARCRGMGPIRLERYGDEILATVERALRPS